MHLLERLPMNNYSYGRLVNRLREILSGRGVTASCLTEPVVLTQALSDTQTGFNPITHHGVTASRPLEGSVLISSILPWGDTAAYPIKRACHPLFRIFSRGRKRCHPILPTEEGKGKMEEYLPIFLFSVYSVGKICADAPLARGRTEAPGLAIFSLRIEVGQSRKGVTHES